MIGIGLGVSLGTFKKDTTLISDSFNRANNASSAGTTEVGGLTWAPYASPTVGGISSNQLYFAAVGAGVDRLIVTPASLPTNYAVQVTFSVATATNQRLMFRFVDANNELFVGAATTNYELSQRLSGTVTSLGATTKAPANGDVVRIEVRGNNISVLINGVYYLTNVVVSTFSTARTFGVLTVGAAAVRFDNFRVEQL